VEREAAATWAEMTRRRAEDRVRRAEAAEAAWAARLERQIWAEEVGEPWRRAGMVDRTEQGT
jgi:hypothetical protein